MQDYFKDALSNFTFEAASGGAIRHLTDLGYTVNQIAERLSFPTPYERIQKVVWEHLIDTETILLEEPGSGRQRSKVTYVKDYGKYGRASFRQVVHPSESDKLIHWGEERWQGNKSFSVDLMKRCTENEEKYSYMSCDFGLYLDGFMKGDVARGSRKSHGEYGEVDSDPWIKLLGLLETEQREYVRGLPWERKIVYHRLDQRMQKILIRLYEAGAYHGDCYFIKTEKKLIL